MARNNFYPDGVRVSRARVFRDGQLYCVLDLLRRPIVILVTVKGGDFHTFGFVGVCVVVVRAKLSELVEDAASHPRVTVFGVLDPKLYLPVSRLAFILEPLDPRFEILFLFEVPA